MKYNFDTRKGPIKIEWMVGAKTNICYNALDRNVEAGHGDKIADKKLKMHLQIQFLHSKSILGKQMLTAALHSEEPGNKR